MHVSSHGLRQDGLSVSGVLVFFVTVAFFSPAVVSHAQDSALLFDGIDDTATIPSTNNWPSSTLALTLEAWIRPTDLSRNDLIAIIWGDSGYAFQQSRTDTSKLVWTISRGPTHSAATPTGSLVEGRWDHFAGTYDGTTMRIYQNGNLVAEEDHTYPGSVLMRGDVVLASRPSATTYAGVIDEVRLWLAVRTQEQISESYHRVLSGAEPDLSGYWRLGEGAGQVISDSSSIANDGVLGSTTAVEPEDPLWTDPAPGLPFFYDGFEDGGTSAWLGVVP